MLIPFFGVVPAGTRVCSELDDFATQAQIQLITTSKVPVELPVHFNGQIVGSAEFHENKARWVGFNPREIHVAVYNVRIHTPEVMALLDQSRPADQLWPTTVLGYDCSDTYPTLTTVFGIDLIRKEDLDDESLV